MLRCACAGICEQSPMAYKPPWTDCTYITKHLHNELSKES